MSNRKAKGEVEMPKLMYHYTNKDGYNSIRAGVDWLFKAFSPPPRDDEHPSAAYFTTLGPDSPNLERLRIPREKREYLFAFEDADDLTPLRGGRGSYIFYSRGDYLVIRDRQRNDKTGERTEVEVRMRSGSGGQS